MNDSILAFSTQPDSIQLLWALNAGFGYDINSASLVEKEGILYYGTKNGFLIAVEGTTGKLLWKYRIGVSLINTVTPLSRNKVALTTVDGEVVVVESH
jgi:outer membrane protein assembly factor BamB